MPKTKFYLDEERINRMFDIAHYIATHGATVRETIIATGYSCGTISRDIEALRWHDYNLYRLVKEIQNRNKKEGWSKGGKQSQINRKAVKPCQQN